MLYLLVLLGVAGATTQAPCSIVPPGEYYSAIDTGKYLHLEVAEDSASFTTRLGDFAESSEEDSDYENDWVKRASWLDSRINFSLGANCEAEIAQDSRQAYARLMVSMSRLIGYCIHPGGLMKMTYNRTEGNLTLGCLTVRRAVDGVVTINRTTVIPKEDKIFVPRGVYANTHEGLTTTLRIVDRQRIWIRAYNDERPVKVSADYFFRNGELCVIPGRNTHWGDLVVLGSYFHKVAGVIPTCFTYSAVTKELTIGRLVFKYNPVL